MTCRDVELLFGELQDGRLEPPDELRMHAHLEDCAACREHVARWRALVPVMRAAVPPSPSPMRLRRMEVEMERQLLRAKADHPITRRTARWTVAVAALVAAAALWFFLRPILPATKSAAPFATVVARSDGASVMVGEALASGARVSLPEEAEVSIQLRALAKLHLVGPAVLALGGDAQHVQLRVESGRLEAEVAHRRAGETFVVGVPDGRVEVRGTRFVVVASPTGSSVRVDEGRVAVFDAQGTEHGVSSGELFSIQPEPVKPVAPESPPVAASPPAPEPDECHAPRVDCSSVVTRTRSAMRVGNYTRALAALEPALRSQSGACAHRPVACADEMGYLRAESLRLGGKLEAAVRAYHALDRPSAPPAMRQNALYAAAQLDRRLHRVSEARAAFERALAVFPTGPLREEAMLGAMDAADESGDRAAAQIAAHRYLASFPTGIGAARARRVEARTTPNPAP